MPNWPIKARWVRGTKKLQGGVLMLYKLIFISVVVALTLAASIALSVNGHSVAALILTFLAFIEAALLSTTD